MNDAGAITLDSQSFTELAIWLSAVTRWMDQAWVQCGPVPEEAQQ